MQARLWGGAAVCVGIAIVSGLAEARRRRRRNLDRVGVVAWPAVQVAAMMGAVILASVALNSG
jgi:hypothetical protein